MKYKKNSNLIYYISIIIIVLFFGCSVEQTHKTLVFFFDGVDKVIYYADNLTHRDSLSISSEAKRMALLKKNRPDQFAHRPYKEKKCEACHTPDKRLIMPMPQLCYKCHGNFNEKYAVVHGPVASGGCLNCHNQHSSRYPKLLIREGQQICLYCHNSTLVFSNKVHRDIEDAECTLCHSPHGGKARYMLKDNISRDANRIALMDDLTYRHLYGQIFCKVPGDVNYIVEIYILDSKEVLVATAHPDAKGKFYLANLHPGQNYYFRFKKDVPDCKINIMDNDGTVLFEVDRDKKSRYMFERSAYESVHNAINDAHELGDTLVPAYVQLGTVTINTDQPVVKEVPLKDAMSSDKETKTANEVAAAPVVSEPIKPDLKSTAALMGDTVAENSVSDSMHRRGNISVKTLNDSEYEAITRLNAANLQKEQATAEQTAGTTTPDTVGYKGKIAVKEMSDSDYARTLQLSALNRQKAIVENGQPSDHKVEDTLVYKGNIRVKTLSDPEYTRSMGTNDAEKQKNAAESMQGYVKDSVNAAPGRKSNIVVITLGESDNGNIPAVINPARGNVAKTEIRKLGQKGIKLSDLTLQVAKFYDGSAVCILNDQGDLVDVSEVDSTGAFLFYDFLSYRVSLPPKKSGIVSQTIFLNDDMEIVDVINKRVVNGRYVYVANSKEASTNKADVRIVSNEGNAILYSSIYFNGQETLLTADGQTKLENAAKYLVGSPGSKAFLAAHTDAGKVNRTHISELRAKAVMDYLVSKGIARNRIKEIGKGNTRVYEIAPEMEDKEQKNKVDVYIKDK